MYPKIIIPLSCFVLLFLNTAAQDTSKYVYQDSSIKVVDSLTTTATTVSDSSEQVTEQSPADTVLHLNNLSLSADSVNDLKNADALAYTKHLDSLLRIWQKQNEQQNEQRDNRPGLLDRFFSSGITEVFMWGLASLFILLILFRLFFTKGFFQKNITLKNVRELAGNDAEDSAPNYDKLIAQAAASLNYRLAVRYLYLSSLQKLADNKLIVLTADKTNYQYINELNNTAFKDDFLWLTLSYEYIWYGEFAIDNQSYAELQNNFNLFNGRLKKQ